MWQWIKDHWRKLFGSESTATSDDSQAKAVARIVTRRSSRLVYARRFAMDEALRMDTIKTRRRRVQPR